MNDRLRARERLQKLPDAQRTAWLDTAEEEFRAFGFEAASLKRILARASISKRQAYCYFADNAIALASSEHSMNLPACTMSSRAKASAH